jgi:hypothetical protein
MTSEQKAYQIDNSALSQSISDITHLPPLPLKIVDEVVPVVFAGNITTVSQNTGFLIPVAGQTIVTKSVTFASNGAALYTVTAGKTFYCTSITYSSTHVGSPIIGVLVAGADVGVKAVVPGIAAGTGIYAISMSGLFFSAASTQAITLYYNGTASTANCIISGFEA